MKKLVLFALIIAACFRLAAAYSQTAQDVFQGLLIYTSGTHCEVKWGSAERSFRLGENVAVTRNGAPAAAGELRVCQLVRVTYNPGEENVAVSIVILRESYCVR